MRKKVKGFSFEILITRDTKREIRCLFYFKRVNNNYYLLSCINSFNILQKQIC